MGKADCLRVRFLLHFILKQHQSQNIHIFELVELFSCLSRGVQLGPCPTSLVLLQNVSFRSGSRFAHLDTTISQWYVIFDTVSKSMCIEEMTE